MKCLLQAKVTKWLYGQCLDMKEEYKKIDALRDHNWLSCSHSSKAWVNLHWCFLAVVLNNMFLWLKLLSVIVSKCFRDSQPSAALMMNPSLASPALPGWCTWGLHLCVPCLSGLDLHHLSGTVFMRNSLDMKHVNALKCSGLSPQTASNYLLDVWSGHII